MTSRVSSPAICFAAIVAIIVGLMLAVVFYLSFYEGLPGIPGGFLTTAHYTVLLKDRFVYRVLNNTLVYTGVAVFVSLLFGVLIAWLVERTDIRGRNLIFDLLGRIKVQPRLVMERVIADLVSSSGDSSERFAILVEGRILTDDEDSNSLRLRRVLFVV